MRIDALSLRGFRNYEEAEARFDAGVNLLVGDNANGKTNLLEAVYYLCAGKSFRTRREAELLRFGAEFAELQAEIFAEEREQNLRAVLFSGRRPRQLFRNGVKQKTAAQFTGTLKCVLFCPEDLQVLRHGAASRRRLLDDVICQLRPNYAAALSEYGRVLEEKSAILRERRGDLRVLLPDYNLRLVQLGALLISYRARFLQSLGELSCEFHREFSGEKERLTLQYRTVSSVTDPFAPLDTLRGELSEHMAAHESAEWDAGQCLSGPHRDDFIAEINDLPVAQFASQGQTRTASISLKLAERALVCRDCGEEPILLLDDVLSELDAARQDFVLNRLGGGQIFITCCETDRLTQLGTTYRIESGKIL